MYESLYRGLLYAVFSLILTLPALAIDTSQPPDPWGYYASSIDARDAGLVYDLNDDIIWPIISPDALGLDTEPVPVPGLVAADLPRYAALSGGQGLRGPPRCST